MCDFFIIQEMALVPKKTKFSGGMIGTYLINIIVYDKIIKANRFELKAKVCNSFNVVNDALDKLPIEISGNVYLLTYQIDSITNIQVGEDEILEFANNSKVKCMVGKG